MKICLIYIQVIVTKIEPGCLYGIPENRNHPGSMEKNSGDTEKPWA